MRRDFGLALAASVAMNLALACHFRGSMEQFILLILAFWVMVFCFGLAACMFVVARISPARQQPAIGAVVEWASPILRRSTTGVVLVGLVAGSAVFSLPFGVALLQYDIHNAKAYCESLQPAIDRHRTETGRYPDRPPGILPNASLPRLLRGHAFYHAQADDYMFDFSDPSGVFSMIVYDSRRGEWQEVHD
ncbi:hypothetical protein [Paludisphaera rhizosphaerae]|uniref:hypothetical protein n=1 Tax=Paludisphaera rhizosphaerae TaxID=2711216 RepID=UPI0013ECDDF6|nr:hypothetical protein [Paludisphaera rhizosphaerae]